MKVDSEIDGFSVSDSLWAFLAEVLDSRWWEEAGEREKRCILSGTYSVDDQAAEQ
jgi:hypothetical protein